MAPDLPTFQSHFHRRWKHLNDPHVRALAWLLDAPDLLDPGAPQWQGRIATLGELEPSTQIWLDSLDRAPDRLRSYLGEQPINRLGRYAEKLMAFYFLHRGTLAAHGVQVQDGKNGTIGEFDFLLRRGEDLLHWEFASKFYLLEADGAADTPDHFLGPNLADTLGAKMRKIMDQQLALSLHPAARRYLPQPVSCAQALVKGWLFHYRRTPQATEGSPLRCRGFWLQTGELDRLAADGFMVLPRMGWLAPMKARSDQCIDRPALQDALAVHFAADSMPVLVALLEQHEEGWLEADRGFIVPDDWRARAGRMNAAR